MEALREKKDCKLFSLFTDVALFITAASKKSPAVFIFYHARSKNFDKTAASKKSPAVFIFYHARSKNFEEKLEGLQNNIHVFFFLLNYTFRTDLQLYCISKDGNIDTMKSSSLSDYSLDDYARYFAKFADQMLSLQTLKKYLYSL